MGIRVKDEGDVFKMVFRLLSEKCLECYCRTCKNSYEYNEEYFSCIDWCEKNCKGKSTEVPEKESCYKSTISL